MAGIQDLSNQIDFNDLTYIYKGESAPISFIGFKDPLHIFKSLYKGDITSESVEKYPKKS